jgi:hypothetical protein
MKTLSIEVLKYLKLTRRQFLHRITCLKKIQKLPALMVAQNTSL